MKSKHSTSGNKTTKEEEVERLRRLVGLMEAMYGLEDYATRLATCHLAHAYEENGELEQAASIFRNVLKGMEVKPGFDDPNTLFVATRLAILWRDTGNPMEAEQLFRQILASSEKLPTQDGWLISTNCQAIGKLLENARRLKEAVGFYNKGLEWTTRIHGPDHPRSRKIAERLSTALDQTRPSSPSHY